ncbi:hypothetical protein Tco_1300585, partial [Tanacetum coccineum]
TPANIHEKVQTGGNIHEKVLETLKDDTLFQQDSVMDWQHDPYHFVDEQQKIAEMVAELNHPYEELFF